jgi:cytochrome c2
VGDFNQDAVMISSAKVSQDSASSFGKTFEIDWKSGSHRMISLGHRNPQGLMVTKQGRVFSTEHGPAGGDELNQVVHGANYGWPNVTFGTDYGSYDWPNSSVSGSHSGYALPTYAWLPSIGVSNLIEIQNFHPSWDGDLLVASLKAATLFRLRLDRDRVVYSEPIWLGTRIRDIAQLKSGAIVLWTDDSQLLIITVDRAKLEKNKRGLGYFGQPELATCMTCHHFDTTGPTHLAPSLGNIVGRPLGSDSFSRYSANLRAKGGVWTIPRLKEFLTNPDAFAPGTSMPKLPLSEHEIVRIVALLAN